MLVLPAFNLHFYKFCNCIATIQLNFSLYCLMKKMQFPRSRCTSAPIAHRCNQPANHLPPQLGAGTRIIKKKKLRVKVVVSTCMFFSFLSYARFHSSPSLFPDVFPLPARCPVCHACIALPSRGHRTTTFKFLVARGSCGKNISRSTCGPN